MKKYFSKYLPVSGEIKEGDYWTDGEKIYEDYNRNDSWKHGNGKMWKKVKLFLCSSDIQPNDKFYREATGNKEFITPSNYKYWEGDYKIIGEISPEAKWVTEGMEFDEGGIKAYMKKSPDALFPIELGKQSDFRIIIKIKCPTCKNFH